ncbi:jasmonate O-methyltransferase-like isoform X1 [Branchiostoma floridae]|uniref:Jasmonate O-methyltransferase-like isoform X1 n=1 Tax=Branchiostoma floridae TaxID=7739 RepID=A0A9J7MNQ6_BRAFL|nr:jasmonate O-methyltransferase-like isoform X1 [Branchiostoma floridae]
MRHAYGICGSLRRLYSTHGSGSKERSKWFPKKVSDLYRHYQNSTPHYIPYGEDGSGFYSDNALGHYDIITNAKPIVMDAINSMEINPTQIFNIVDYGSADGGTSMPLFYQIVDKLRQTYGDALPIHVTYEDQPVADFKSLFMRLHGLLPMPDNHGYLKGFNNVYVSACGTSFYDQCLPNAFVNFGFSSTAMHWLSRGPCPLPDAVFHMVSSCGEAKEAFAKQAAQDWELILLQRARELAPGGRMVINVPTIDEDGYFGGGRWDSGKVNVFQKLSSLWHTFALRGRITKEEFVNTNIFGYKRVPEEVQTPFVNKDSRVRKAGLTLVCMETKHTPCAFHARWQREGGNARQHAEQFVNMLRSWSIHAFHAGLSKGRTEEEKTTILESFFNEYEDEVAAAPEEHSFELMSSFLHIKKEY